MLDMVEHVFQVASDCHDSKQLSAEVQTLHSTGIRAHEFLFLTKTVQTLRLGERIQKHSTA